MPDFKKVLGGTLMGALVLIFLILMFWPAQVPVTETVRALAPPECEAPEVVFLPFPVRVPFYSGRSKGHARASVDPWKCWYSDRLEDWMCPVPAGAPFN